MSVRAECNDGSAAPAHAGFYPKNLMLIAQALDKLGRKAEAREWLQRCLAAEMKTPEDQETRKVAEKLKI